MSQPFFIRRLTRASGKQSARSGNAASSCGFLRAQAVYFSSERLTAERIALIVDRDRSTVYRWLKEFDAHGLPALCPGKSTGRPPRPTRTSKPSCPSYPAEPPRLGLSLQPLVGGSAHRAHAADDARRCQLFDRLPYAQRLGYRYGCPNWTSSIGRTQGSCTSKWQKARALKNQRPSKSSGVSLL